MMSATHRYHPDPAYQDPEDAVLYDNCERCDEHAKAPNAGLDAGNLYALDQRRRAGTGAATMNDMKAMNQIGQAVHLANTIAAERRRRGPEGEGS
jgi:hypothetical protein